MEFFLQAIEMLIAPKSELRQIIGVTIRMSFFSTMISCLLGMPLGALIGSRSFPAKRYVMRVFQTLMGLPPVVAGLIVFMFLSRRGPFGFLGLLFSVRAMVIAQIVLITPVVTCLTANLIAIRANLMLETTAGMGLSRAREFWLLLYESRISLITVLLNAFGRSIAEVGAVQMVGGNVQFKTRVMTTAIVLETNKGNFELAVALGVVLLLLSFVINSLAQRFQEGRS